MKIGIVGSRNFSNYEVFKILMNSIDLQMDMIISGGASGVDEMAYKYAIEKGITFVCQPPNPNEPSPQRFRRRNLRIVSMSEFIIALPNKTNSPGTWHTINLAKKLNKPVKIIEVRG